MGILSNISEVELQTQLEAEKERIVKFLTQYSWADRLYVSDDERKINKLSNDNYQIITLLIPNCFTHSTTIDSSIEESFNQINRTVTKYYLELVNNQWIISPITNFPIPIVDYYADLFPDYIKFKNGTSLCYLRSGGYNNNSYSNVGNFGY